MAEHRQELVDELVRVAAHPEHQRRPGVRRRGVAQRRLARAAPAARRVPERGDLADRRASPRCSPSGRATTRTRRPSLVYGHHDVQPVDPVELWETAPFEPLVRATAYGEELVGRGAIDDKGQVYFHVLGLARAPRDHRAHLARGEPQGDHRGRGGVGLAALRRAAHATHRERLRCDVVVVSDTGVYGRDAISVCVGMRGMVEVASSTCAARRATCTPGSFGGAVPEPGDGARPDRRAAARRGRPRHAARLLRQRRPAHRPRARAARRGCRSTRRAGSPTRSPAATHGEEGFTTLERIWARPTAEVNGIWGGYTGPGGKTIIPSEAHVKLSFRLVAGQSPSDVAPRVRRAGSRSCAPTARSRRASR